MIAVAEGPDNAGTRRPGPDCKGGRQSENCQRLPVAIDLRARLVDKDEARAGGSTPTAARGTAPVPRCGGAQAATGTIPECEEAT